MTWFWTSRPVAGVGLKTSSGSKATIHLIVKELFIWHQKIFVSQTHTFWWSLVALALPGRSVSCEFPVKCLCLYLRSGLSSMCKLFCVCQCPCCLCSGLLCKTGLPDVALQGGARLSGTPCSADLYAVAACCMSQGYASLCYSYVIYVIIYSCVHVILCFSVCPGKRPSRGSSVF